MKKKEPQIDRPRVYYTSRGERYVKAEELLQSTRGRDAVKRMAAFAKRQSVASIGKVWRLKQPSD